MSRSILLVDDDPGVLGLLSRVFEREGWQVSQALTAEDGLRLWEVHAPDVVVLDLHLPGLSGMRALEVLAARDAAVVVLTGDADVSRAVEAMRQGAFTYLTKPVSLDAVREAAAGAAERAAVTRMSGSVGCAGPAAAEPSPLGTSPRMRELDREVQMLATADGTTVLLLGESGTGKSWLAQRLHGLSSRARGPFIEVNCASLTSTFLDSELFGHERGAFTDARETKRGLFEIADRGTLFLDEVGELSTELQPKLLKVLESRTFRRLGGTRELTTDVRLVAATNTDLNAAVRSGAFREDLFYRLAVFPLTLPPLRERSAEDLTALLNGSLRDLAARLDGAPSRISPRALDLLLRYPWPGNVRELRNVVERALVLGRGSERIEPHHLPDRVRAARPVTAEGRDGATLATLDEAQIIHIQRALYLTQGNRSEAARLLGISRSTLHVKIKEHGLDETGTKPRRSAAAPPAPRARVA